VLATFFLSMLRLHRQIFAVKERHLAVARIDEATIARVLTIATSVAAITIGRLILKPLGYLRIGTVRSCSY
jgi:hypothetical protein